MRIFEVCEVAIECGSITEYAKTSPKPHREYPSGVVGGKSPLNPDTPIVVWDPTHQIVKLSPKTCPETTGSPSLALFVLPRQAKAAPWPLLCDWAVLFFDPCQHLRDLPNATTLKIHIVVSRAAVLAASVFEGQIPNAAYQPKAVHELPSINNINAKTVRFSPHATCSGKWN